MKQFTVSVTKLTDEELMRQACESTFAGKSHVSLSSIYKSEHSPARTQMFWIELKNIPLFVSTHLIRHHVGSVPFQLTCRDDRKGGNPDLPARIDDILSDLELVQSGTIYRDTIDKIVEKLEWIKYNTDRQTPVNLSLLVNAQSLIDMAKLRLCKQAHKDTITVFQEIKFQLDQIDPNIANLMVPKCVYRNGLCGEPHCCGYNSTLKFREQLKDYVSQFSEKQRGKDFSKSNDNDRNTMASE